MPNRLKLDPEEFEKDWNAGMPKDEMSEKYNCSISSVENYVRYFGLQRRPTKPRNHLRDASPDVLTKGQWIMTDRGIQVWAPNY